MIPEIYSKNILLRFPLSYEKVISEGFILIFWQKLNA